MALRLLYTRHPAVAWRFEFMENAKMNLMCVKLFVKFQDLLDREDGQDLVEYALLISLIALGVVTASTALRTGIVTIFTNISTSLA